MRGKNRWREGEQWQIGGGSNESVKGGQDDRVTWGGGGREVCRLR